MISNLSRSVDTGMLLRRSGSNSFKPWKSYKANKSLDWEVTASSFENVLGLKSWKKSPVQKIDIGMRRQVRSENVCGKSGKTGTPYKIGYSLCPTVTTAQVSVELFDYLSR